MLKRLLFLSLLFVQSCAVRENIYDTQTKEAIGGYKKGHFLIGKTNRADITADKEKEWRDKGVVLFFDQSTDLLKAIEIRGTTRYKMSKKIGLGDDLSQVEKVYGKPLRRKVNFGHDRNVYWEWQGLFYKNKSFMTDTTGKKVLVFSLGNVFNL